MLTTILGNLGSGKTLLMVILSYYSNKPIISNFELNFSNRKVEKLNLNKFLRAEYEDCVILLDEAYTYLEARISNSELNRIMSYILFQSRKKNVELYLTAQLLGTIDKRYRELCDTFIVAQQNESFFRYYFLIKSDIQDLEYVFDFRKDFVVPFFECYNTNEVILTNNAKLLFDVKDSDEKLEEIDKFTSEIEDYYHNEKKLKNITRDMVDLYIQTNEKIPKFLSKSIYTSINLNAKEKKKKSKKVNKNE